MKVVNRAVVVCGLVFSIIWGASGYNLALHWQGVGGSGVGDYDVASNWTEGAVPALGDLAAFNNTGTKNWLVNFTGDVSNETFSIVVPPAAYESAFNLNGHTYWATNSFNLWQGAGGRVTVSNGTFKTKTASFAPAPDGTTTNVVLKVCDAAFELEWAAFSAAHATFDGGSLWVSNRLSVGSPNRGWSTVRLVNGARVGVTNDVYIADANGATGTLVNAGGEFRYSGANMMVGRYGYGELTLEGGTSRIDRFLTVGTYNTSVGTLTVQGGSNIFGSLSNDRLIIGDLGRGSLLGGGGTNNVFGIAVGNSAGGIGATVVTGGLWLISEHMWVGMFGGGSLLVNGGEMRFTGGGPVLAIGRNAGATGEVTVAGGLVDMGGNGSVWMGRADQTATNISSRLVLTGTGVLRAKQVFEFAAAATAASQILFDGGTLKASASGALVYDVDDVRLTANGMVIDSAGFNVSVATVLQDEVGQAGGITKKGAGTLTLAGTRAATGSVSVLGGTLVVSNGVAVAAGTSRIDGTLSLTSANRLSVGAGAALAGTGTVARVTLQDEAVFARDKADGASTPLMVSDCVAEDRLTVALTGYSLSELKSPVPLLRVPTAFMSPSKVTVLLNGQGHPFLKAKFVEVSGQQVLVVSYSTGTLITVM